MTRSKNGKFGIGLIVIAWVTASMACSSATSGNDALNQVSSAFCARAVACECTGVVQSTCATDVSSTYKGVGFDTNGSYTADSVNKCTGEIKAMACPSPGACTFTVPPSCPGQGALLPILTAAADAGTESDATPE